jgi:hypothetical protein
MSHWRREGAVNMNGVPRYFIVTVTTLVACMACAPKGGGGGHAGAALRPGTITLTPRMISGKGTLTLVPKGERVALTLHAESLPPPGTYSLWLARPGTEPGERLAFIVAIGGRIDFTKSYPASLFAGWSEVQLMHQPSSHIFNLHPALVGKLPVATPTH